MSEEELIKTVRVFEKNRVEQLEEPARNLFYAIMKIADERDRLNNIMNELENYFNKIKDTSTLEERMIAKYMLKYIKELKGEDKE